MKYLILNSFILTIVNIFFMIILLLSNTNQKTGSLLHQMIVFFSIILLIINILVVFLVKRFKLVFLQRGDVFIISLVLYLILLCFSSTIDSSNDLFINFMFVSSFFISMTIFFLIRNLLTR
jgi:hypothetical protein